MTNKIDTVLKAITDRITRALPSYMVKKLKLNVNPTSPVLSAHSCPTENPQCSSHPLNSINAIKTCYKETNHSQRDQLQTVMKIGTRQSEESEQTIEDEFKDLHLNLPILKVLAHAPIYNAILDKYVKSLKLGKNGFAFIQGKMPTKIKDPRLFTLPCKLGDSKPFNTIADLGSCVNIIPLDVEVHIGKLKLLNNFYVVDTKKDPETPLLVGKGFLATANVLIDYRKAKIAVGEGITRSIFEVKEIDLGEEEAPY
uniref:Reverse transcriptase domain-containing protein n=1 Tax=Tanacetum cinerariifolium TaxID=118510 RepID=A0A699K859_TANCI|nr:hypothetical protein [Tanacetum cinerariifolium]